MLFKQGIELKKYVSGIDASFDIDNIENSLLNAEDQLADIIGADLFDMAETHYISDQYNLPGEVAAKNIRMNKLVELLRSCIAPLAIHDHFVWLTIRVSNSSVTTTKSSNETAAYKYQTDEAKSQLLQQGYAAITRLIAFINKEAVPFTLFAPLTEYKAGDICMDGALFYVANAAFKSGETFDALDWTEKPADEMVFLQWILCDTRQTLNRLIFTDYKDFNRYFGIDNNAVFFVLARYIIEELIDKYIKVRFPNPLTSDKLPKIKRFLAYQTVADAIMRMDVNLLPKSLRGPINSEMNKKGGDVEYIREKLRANLLNQASDYLKSLDMEITSDQKTTEEAPLSDYESNMDADNKYVSMI